MELQIEYKSVNDLIPYINNSRVHSDRQIKMIAASIREFGFNNPVLVDCENTIIAGHGRVEAAKMLDIKDVPTVCIDTLSDAQKKAYVIADNKIAEHSSWDYDVLKNELEYIKECEPDFDISIIGFDDDTFPGEVKQEDNLDKSDLVFSLEVVVEVSSEKEQENLFNEMTDRGYKCRILSI